MPVLAHVWGVRAITDTGVMFLVAEGVAAGCATFLALSTFDGHQPHDTLAAFLGRAATSAQEGLRERAEDCATDAVRRALGVERSRHAVLARLRRILAADDPAVAAIIVTSVATSWSAMSPEDRAAHVDVIAGYVAEHRIAPHRLLR